jgi:hypothetical protein
MPVGKDAQGPPWWLRVGLRLDDCEVRRLPLGHGLLQEEIRGNGEMQKL